MEQLFQFSSGFFSVVTLYAQTFAVFKIKTNLLPSIAHSTLDVIAEVSRLNQGMKRHAEKVTAFGGDKLKLFLDGFSRNLSWFLGMTAYKLILIKDEKDASKAAEKEQEKIQDLIIQSNLLSGGIENRYITLFSSEALGHLEDLIKVSEDKKLLEMLKAKPMESSEDILVESILHPGKNTIIDKVLGYLQNGLETRQPFVPYARLAGADGMRLSRAAFAVMIKFSEFFSDFSGMVDEVDFQWSQLEGDDERDFKIKQTIKAMPNYDMILKRWDSASKMRQWVNEKKKNLSDKVKKDVEAEYKKKKEESPKQEETKAEAPKDDKPEEAEEKKAQEPVKEEEIVLIDTTEPAKVDGMGFTEADKAAIEDLSDKRFNEELQAIFGKIVEKAEFLVKLQVPGSYLF